MTFYELRQESRRFCQRSGRPWYPKETGGTAPAQLASVSDAYYAILSIGGIVRQLNPLYTPDETETDGQYFWPDVPGHLQCSSAINTYVNK